MTDSGDGSLIAATVDGTTVSRGGKFGVTAEGWRVQVLAVLTDGSVIIKTYYSDEQILVERFAVGANPTRLVSVESGTSVYVADDASVVVTIREVGSADDDDAGADDGAGELELAIYRPASGAPPRTLALDCGQPGPHCFAPGNRHFVVSVLDDDGNARVLAVDLVSAAVVVLLAEAASPFAVSPDGQLVVVRNRTLMIVPIEGGAPRTTTIEGSPEAWLR